MTMKQNQRRAFRVTSSLQYRFLAISISYSFIIVCFFAIAVFVPDMVEMRDQSLNPVIRGVAASRVLSKNVWVWPAILSLIIILGLHSFFMFKKIIGPLFRFRCVFGELGGGNLLSRFKLRKKDYLHTEEEALWFSPISGMASTGTGERGSNCVRQSKGATAIPPTINAARISPTTSLFSRQ